MTGALAVWLALAPAPRPMEAHPPPHRWHEVLASPPACDIYRFPDKYRVWGEAWLAWRFRQRLLAQSQNEFNRERCWRYQQAYCEMYGNWWAWELLYAIHYGNCCEWETRLKLAELRDLIGEDAYDRGEMPESVPGHLFHDLKR